MFRRSPALTQLSAYSCMRRFAASSKRCSSKVSRVSAEMSSLTISNGTSEKLMGYAPHVRFGDPLASLPHVLVGSLIFSLFSFEDLDSNTQSTSFGGAIRTYFDIHDLSKNSVLDLFVFLASDAFHFEPPELLVTY